MKNQAESNSTEDAKKNELIGELAYLPETLQTEGLEKVGERLRELSAIYLETFPTESTKNRTDQEKRDITLGRYESPITEVLGKLIDRYKSLKECNDTKALQDVLAAVAPPWHEGHGLFHETSAFSVEERLAKDTMKCRNYAALAAQVATNYLLERYSADDIDVRIMTFNSYKRNGLRTDEGHVFVEIVQRDTEGRISVGFIDVGNPTLTVDKEGKQVIKSTEEEAVKGLGERYKSLGLHIEEFMSGSWLRGDTRSIAVEQ